MPPRTKDTTRDDLRRAEREIGENIPTEMIGEDDDDVRDVDLVAEDDDEQGDATDK